MTDYVARDVLMSLAEVRTRERRYIALQPDEIHLRSPHLPVMQTPSGWWISKNIGRDQLMGALRELCRISELDFGVDVKFSLKRA